MYRPALPLCLLLFLVSLSPLSAATIPIVFDAIPDGRLQAPFVGSGSFTFETDPGDGTHALSSLGAYSFLFTVGGFVFDNGTLLTPESEILVVLSTGPGGRSVNFSNVFPQGSGFFGGAIDFEVSTQNYGLSFEPPVFNGNLDMYMLLGLEEGTIYFANYGSTAEIVPEPAAVPAVLAAFVLLATLHRRRRT